MTAGTFQDDSLALAYFFEAMHQQDQISLEEWASNILESISEYFDAIQGTFYVVNHQENKLEFLAGFASVAVPFSQKGLHLGESTAGQAALSEKYIFRQFDEHQAIIFQTGTVQLSAQSLLALPLSTNEKVGGVIEMVFHKKLEQEAVDFLKNLSFYIASNLKIRLQEEELIQRNKQLQQKNNLITTSIKYAKKTQEAILPQPHSLANVFSDCFIIYQPKDVVSGDFYWISQLHISQADTTIKKTILVCADCTGHGVAGALMSMVGHTLLNEIVNQKQHHKPGEIITHLHESIQTTLRQEETGNTDGMDLIICTFEKRTDGQTKLTFAGAKRNLIIIQDQELIEMKGDRVSIGGNQNAQGQQFAEYSRLLKPSDLIYLSTDGYEDSPNIKRKKFGYAKLKGLLRENASLPLAEQKEFLLTQLAAHTKGSLQRDDITILGLQL